MRLWEQTNYEFIEGEISRRAMVITVRATCGTRAKGCWLGLHVVEMNHIWTNNRK